jgi:protein AbiQ
MIPVVPSAIFPVDISTIPDPQYRELLRKQSRFIRANEPAIIKKATRLYHIVISGKQPRLNNRCCNFSLLEQVAAQIGMVSSQAVQETAAGQDDD